MKNKIVVFGSGDIAELAHYYFSNDSDYTVAAFTADREYISNDSIADLPVVPFDDVVSLFPPEKYKMFIALSYAKLNQLRKQKFEAAQDLGYELVSYVSSYATVLNQGRIGKNCFILEDNTIQPFVEIHDNVTLWSGNHIGHHSVIASHSFLASQIVVSGGVRIGEQCFIGVNATLRDHIEIGEKCVIGAGSLLLNDATPESVFLGPETKKSRAPSSRLFKI